MSGEFLERLIPVVATLAREAREGRVPNLALAEARGGLQEDLRGAKEELEELLRTTRRIFGDSHPRVGLVKENIEGVNFRLGLSSKFQC